MLPFGAVLDERRHGELQSGDLVLPEPLIWSKGRYHHSSAPVKRLCVGWYAVLVNVAFEYRFELLNS